MEKPNILDRAIMAVAPVHAAKRAAARAALSVINSGYGNYGANLTKKYERMDVQRRQRQGGHRGQHRHSAAAEPRRLHGHPNGNGGTENHADKRCSRRIDACAAARQRLSGTGRGGGGEAASADRAGSSPLWADTPVCDAERMDNFYQLQQLAFLSYLMNGDTIALLPMKHQAGVPYDLRVRLIEADRVCSPDGFDRLMPCTVQGYEVQSIVQGVETDADGMVTAYWICNRHPLAATAPWTRRG